MINSPSFFKFMKITFDHFYDLDDASRQTITNRPEQFVKFMRKLIDGKISPAHRDVRAIINLYRCIENMNKLKEYEENRRSSQGYYSQSQKRASNNESQSLTDADHTHKD